MVVADIQMPKLRGLDLMKRLHMLRPEQLVILITAFGSIDLGVQAVREGAADFVTKPFRIEHLAVVIERTLRERQMRREIVRLNPSSPTPLSSPSQTSLIAQSQPMLRVADLARRAARFDSTILITGESGVGKGALARFIHTQSGRSQGPFVHVNAAALPEPLAESELFGVRRGAFTDAREDRPGLFVQANGGTLFLDEVAELPPGIQSKLLLALEQRHVRAVGASQDTPVDLRLISATNNALDRLAREGRFRQDLYYRLNVIHIHIPPLRERPEDIEPLVDAFVRKACERLGRPLLGVSAPAMRWIAQQPWPGNVRELANIIERAVALSDHDSILLDDLTSPPPSSPSDAENDDALRALLAGNLSLQELEERYLQAVLKTTGGNKTETARRLGIDRRTLYRKLKDGKDS